MVRTVDRKSANTEEEIFRLAAGAFRQNFAEDGIETLELESAAVTGLWQDPLIPESLHSGCIILLTNKLDSGINVGSLLLWVQHFDGWRYCRGKIYIFRVEKLRLKISMSEIEDNPSDKKREIESAKKALRKEVYLSRILGKSKIIREIRKKIDLISSCDGSPSVLISGESGTGKELVASTIHYISNRSGKPFVPVNCSALPESLFESEFFGHLKGAFTGASVSRKGVVEEAEGGTLFLDEIGTISPYIQVKFLRLLQEGEYKPLGDPRIHHADVRVIAATNKNLMHLVRNETFREDLFYRLSPIPFHILPLRERREDVPILARHFMSRYSKRYRKTEKELSEDAMKYLISYQWPGNIRELENIIQRLVVMCTASTITASDVTSFLNESDCSAEDIQIERLKDAKRKHEKTYLIKLLKTCDGNVVYAAKRAGVSRTALWNHFRKHEIAPVEFRRQE